MACHRLVRVCRIAFAIGSTAVAALASAADRPWRIVARRVAIEYWIDKDIDVGADFPAVLGRIVEQLRLAAR